MALLSHWSAPAYGPLSHTRRRSLPESLRRGADDRRREPDLAAARCPMPGGVPQDALVDQAARAERLAPHDLPSAGTFRARGSSRKERARWSFCSTASSSIGRHVKPRGPCGSRRLPARGAQHSQWHCQVNRCGDVCGQSEGDIGPSRCLMDAGLLSPSPEHLRANPSIAGCGHEMSPRPEMTVDHRVRRQEPLCLAGRLEPLHLPLSSSSGSMRTLGSIDQVPARPMRYIGQDRLSDAIATQAVRYEASCFVSQPMQ
jgi:hypothetical protein